MVFNSRRMRSITNLFIANLALSDVVIGTFSIPFQFQVRIFFFAFATFSTKIYLLLANCRYCKHAYLFSSPKK